MLSVSFVKSPAANADTLILTLRAGGRPGPAAQAFDKDSGGMLTRYLATHPDFKGKAGKIGVIAPGGRKYARVVLAGTGNPAGLSGQEWEELGGKIYAAVCAAGGVKITLQSDDLKASRKVSGDEAAARLASGFLLRSYRFDRYKSKKKDKDDVPGRPESLAVATATAAGAARAFKPLQGLAEGVFWARDLMNEPPNVLYPDSFARRVKAELAPLGVEVTVLDDKKLEKAGFGAHMAVGQGSAFPPRAVVMHWKGRQKGPRLAFVGKGITFDTGGISIKPAAGMEEMKFDMGGAAAVVGLMRALAVRKARADVVAIIGLAENMPSDRAYRPSDIVRSLSGKTIEVLNTDAEGRLVLADAMTYIQRTYKPAVMIDLATLTGAVLVALGQEYCGTYANDNALWKKLDAASEGTGEKLWRMPLDPAFKKSMESSVADLRNTSTMGRNAGSCTAAGFLEHFVEDKTAWAHLDIAGTAWVHADKPLAPKQATGFGVRLLDRLVRQYE